MGKGDKKTKKGKISKGSWGVSRRKRKSSDNTVGKNLSETKEKPVKKKPAKKTTNTSTEAKGDDKE